MIVKASEVNAGDFLWGATAASDSFKVQEVVVVGDVIEFKGTHGARLGTLHRYQHLDDSVNIARAVA